MQLEIVKKLEHLAANAHQVMPRFRWVHKCEDNNAVQLPASVSTCPHCDTVNEDHHVFDMAELSHAA